MWEFLLLMGLLINLFILLLMLMGIIGLLVLLLIIRNILNLFCWEWMEILKMRWLFLGWTIVRELLMVLF